MVFVLYKYVNSDSIYEALAAAQAAVPLRDIQAALRPPGVDPAAMAKIERLIEAELAPQYALLLEQVLRKTVSPETAKCWLEFVQSPAGEEVLQKTPRIAQAAQEALAPILMKLQPRLMAALLE